MDIYQFYHLVIEAFSVELEMGPYFLTVRKLKKEQTPYLQPMTPSHV